jgi:hypothetical protein
VQVYAGSTTQEKRKAEKKTVISSVQRPFYQFIKDDKVAVSVVVDALQARG